MDVFSVTEQSFGSKNFFKPLPIAVSHNVTRRSHQLKYYRLSATDFPLYQTSRGTLALIPPTSSSSSHSADSTRPFFDFFFDSSGTEF